MGKVLYVHDGPTERYGQSIFGGSFTNKYVQRYLMLGDSVTKLTRVREITNKAELIHYSEVTNPACHFIALPEFKTLRTFKNVFKLKKLLRTEVKSHDVIVVKFPSYSSAYAWKVARKLNKPVLIEMGGCPFDSLLHYDWRGKILAPFVYFKYKRILNIARHIVYVTNEFLQRRYPTFGKSIGCSNVELPSIIESNLDSRINKINNLDDKSPLTLLTVASLTSYKGHADVLKALYLLKDEGIIINYNIIGNGNAVKLKQIVTNYDLGNQVKFLGGLPHTQIFDQLQKCDIYIQPSRTEGLPRSVVEALSMACPVLGSNAGGIPELIHEECIFKKGNARKLVNLLNKVDKPFLLKHAKLNFETSKDYQQEVLNERRMEFYSAFLKDFSK